MSSLVGDLGQAAYYLSTDYLQQSPVHYPYLGSLLSKELGNAESRAGNGGWEERGHRLLLNHQSQDSSGTDTVAFSFFICVLGLWCVRGV
jgi:hypothetical protein